MTSNSKARSNILENLHMQKATAYIYIYIYICYICMYVYRYIYIIYIYIIQHELRGIDRASKSNDFATSFHRGFVHGTFLEILEFL